MSSAIYSQTGYGICVDNIKCNDVSRIEALLHQAPEFNKSVKESLDIYLDEGETPTLEDYLCYDEDNFFGLANLLREVILEAEGIQLTVCEDDEYGMYLLYLSKYPWESNPSVENALTEDSLRKIIAKYVSILTDTPIAFGECTTVQYG